MADNTPQTLPTPGERIAAVAKVEAGVVYMLGFGTYEGDAVPMEAKGVVATVFIGSGQKSPRLKLDDGTIVYGCECWWSSEVEFNQKIGDLPRQVYTVKQMRQDAVDQSW